MTQAAECWHLSKSIIITQIASIILLVAGFFIWGSDVEKGITANTQAIQHESAMHILGQKHMVEFKGDIQTRLQRIDSKLERLIEQATKLIELVLADKELGQFFEATQQTINNWKNKHPELFESKKG
ncbi:hypothetical protein ACJJH9_06070 [Microbulbifer sp. DLAB2-AF]|uniref:hypothetical protein n=1 Tax=Microbulbifer sp. DLAB2-AF TaxID=3243395 RepID=UPI004039601B